ncbi:MbnP family protein [Pedobacter sp. CFBP9032]|uniref:MbnP family protein n=1 Tax=Pedobacter sp. CFBP9032 TaxID=3096539 RepID=UPI002A6B75BA|nr:MbnP family protein [Pedobacter sp. CFBP9032]MDY0904940.1 MbnP family protein [Pedobacter sp. CFBP9032]
MKLLPYLLALLCPIILLSSCKKNEEEIATDTKSSFTLEFEHQVNGAALNLNTTTYKNAKGEDFKINVFKYYVSNVKLSKTDGTTYLVPESYFLIDESKPSSKLITVNNVPTGDYTKIEYTIGVDYARNFAGAQTGALDPVNGMFWTWNSGYIFVKLEGTSPQSKAQNNALTFHIGGVLDPNNTIRTYVTEINSANPLRIRTDSKPDMHFIVNAASLFTGTTDVSFTTLNFTMGGANSVIVADNYAKGMFRLDHIHN